MFVAVGGRAQETPSNPGTDAQLDAARDARETAQARALYEEGVAAAETQDWKLAADRFGRAQSLRPSAATAYNLAAALGHLDRCVEAAELLRATLRDDQAPSSVRDSARTLLARLEPRVATLTIRLRGASVGVSVELDGDPLKASQLDVGMPVDPGRHTVVARRDGEPLEERTVDTDEGTAREVTLEIPEPGKDGTRAIDLSVATSPAPPPPAPPLRRAPPADGSILTTWWFWTAVGVVATGAIVAGIVIAESGSEPSSGATP